MFFIKNYVIFNRKVKIGTRSRKKLRLIIKWGKTMEDKFRIVKSYKEDKNLRNSFNELAKKVFDLDFEDWYQNGYWKEQYNPYSIVYHDRVVANVSVSDIEFEIDGRRKYYIQLGTVMTEQKYRKKGFIRRLMEEIEQDFNGKIDGYFLFANDSVLEFYPKFGFQKCNEYRYSKAVCVEKEKTALQVAVNNLKERECLEAAIINSVTNSSFEMKNNLGLVMFYVTKFMQSDVYYIESQNAYVIAEIYNKILFLHAVFSDKAVNMEEIIQSFGRKINRVILGFTPLEKEGYEVAQLHEEDTTLFLKGIDPAIFEKEKRMVPTLSHT